MRYGRRWRWAWLSLVTSIVQIVNSGESGGAEVKAEVEVDIPDSSKGATVTRTATATLATGKITRLDRDGKDPNDPWKYLSGGTDSNSVTYKNIQKIDDGAGLYTVAISGSGKKENSGGKPTGAAPKEFAWAGSGEYKIFDVEKIEYKSGKGDNDWTDVPADGLVVAKDGNITFRAVPTKNAPTDWYGKLQWTNVDSTSKDIAKVKFNNASTTPTDKKEITAHLGNPAVAKKIQVVVVDLSKLPIKAKRINEPVESDHFVILEGEHFETGGIFEFKLELEAKLDDGTKIKWPFPVFMGAEILNMGVNSALLTRRARLADEMISYKFEDNSAANIGNCLIRYYFDDNFSNNYSVDNPCDDSKKYHTMEIVSHKLTFAVASSISTLPQSIEEMIKTANDLFLKKERYSVVNPNDDYRACIKISQNGDTKILEAKHSVIHVLPVWGYNAWLSIFEPNKDKVIGYYDEWDEEAALRKLNYNCNIVKEIHSMNRNKTEILDYLGGLTGRVGTMSIIIAAQPKYNKVTFMHEFGHGRGIKGDYQYDEDDYLHLMYFSPSTVESHKPLLKKSEAAIIDGGK